jgi:esterase/lipase superfamily enzyme
MMQPSSHPGRILVLISVLLLAGCATQRVMMPTPKLYGMGLYDAHDQLDPALESATLEMLYVTDRTPITTEEGKLNYGFERSASLAYGKVPVTIEVNGGWKSLEKDSKTLARSGDFNLDIGTIEELGRTPPSPFPYTLVNGFPQVLPKVKADLDRVTEGFRENLLGQLARTPIKEVIIFVHGVANSFAYSAYTTFELWHYLGREGVPITYSWPAGHGGALRGYTYDRESSEFTIYHFKKFLQLISAMPEVEDIQIIAHSRGTDVVTTGFRELLIESRARGEDPHKHYKIRNIVLAAPDIDVGVLLQRTATEYLGSFVERLTIYTSKDDKAIGISSFLFGGLRRLGQAGASAFPERVRKNLKEDSRIAFIEYTGTNTGSFGHDYFRTNPAVSSDLVLTVRYDRNPGAKNGRPLRHKDLIFWTIDDDYLDTVQ